MRPLEWVGNSLAATDYTEWVQIPRGTKKMSIGIGWPSTGTPVGVLAVVVCNHGRNGVAGASYPITISTQPAGTAATLFLDNIDTAAGYIGMTYTATTGGTGAVFTDETGVAGTVPKLVFHE
jgi:hypothetical protein